MPRYVPFHDQQYHENAYRFTWWASDKDLKREGDRQIFQNAERARDYRAAKREAQSRSPGFVCKDRTFTDSLQAEVHGTILTELREAEPEQAAALARVSLDDLLMELQPDLAVVAVDRAKQCDWLCYLHVLLPSSWDPEKMLSLSFSQVHKCVPIVKGVEGARGLQGDSRPQGTRAFMSVLKEKKPRYRFVWGLQTHDRLDCHPRRHTPPEFDGSHLWLRVERQVLLPLREHDALLFLIHPYVDPVARLSLEQGASLLRAVDHMGKEEQPPGVLKYKFGEDYEGEYRRILAFLEEQFGTTQS